MSELMQYAVRQYRHNNSDGFVIAYDTKETDKVVAGLEAQVQSLQQQQLEWVSVEDDYT